MSDTLRLKDALADRYAIEREVGRGGMATVYLARDVRHDRQVAVKVLEPELGAVLGAERFLAEIRVTANLQHPNLLPLFDSGEAAGLLFYVMPFVDGETLRARLERERQLPVDEAVRIATAVANALDYAHSHGVIHRDLKPENILLQAGQPVVADFGIALAVSKAGGQRITQTGLSLGTPHYMSPEQATGDRAVDGRSDIYSLGAMTYEMLTGEAPHTGTTAQAIVAKLMTEEVRPLTVLRRSVPMHIDAAVRHALEKLPADRFATAREFSEALSGRGPVTVPAEGRAAGRAGVAPRTGWRRFANREAVAWLVAAGALAALAFRFAQSPEVGTELVYRYNLVTPPNERVFTGAAGNQIAISPSGDRVVYLVDDPSGLKLYATRSDQLEPRHLGNAAGIRSIVFSPDGRWIAYSIGSDVHKMAVDGGPPVPLGRLDLPVFGLSWAEPDSIVIGTSRGLYSLGAAGGTARLATRRDSSGATELQYFWPLALPGGEFAVYATIRVGSAASQLAIASLRTGETRLLGTPGAAPIGIADGQLLFGTSAGVIMAAPFDVRRGLDATVGAPVPVVEGVVTDGTGAPKASYGSAGALVFVSGLSNSVPVLVTVGGGSRPLLAEPRAYNAPRFSPDGKKVAFTVTGSATGRDVSVFDLVNGTFGRVTTDGLSQRPEWSPDGSRVLFRVEQVGRVSIGWRPADGSGEMEVLHEPDDVINEVLMSPDGKWIIYRTAPGGRYTQDIFAVPLEGERTPVALVTGPAGEIMPRVSPDSRWLAYMSNESGPYEVYVRPFPGAGARVQISTSGGSEPLWSKDGRTLYYRRGNEFVAVPVVLGSTFSRGEPKVVHTEGFLIDATHQNWDVSPDGTQFVLLRRAGEEPKIVVVQNWAQELAQRLRGTANQ